MNKETIIAYYRAICKNENIEPVPVMFRNVSKGGASISHNKRGHVFCINIDMRRCYDIEYGIIHELTHQILILRNNNYSHNNTFTNLQNKLIDKYMYSKFTNILLDKQIFQ